jgi:hypothetical protein
MRLRKIEPVLAVGLRRRARRWLIDLAGGGRSRDAIKSRESSYVLAVVRGILRPNHAVTENPLDWYSENHVFEVEFIVGRALSFEA